MRPNLMRDGLTKTAIYSLMRKEFQHLKPLVLVLIALIIWQLGDALISSSPDQVSWLNYSILYDQGLSGSGFYFSLAGIFAAYLVLHTDRAQGTLRFLYSLPIKRSHIFNIKLLTAFLVLATLTAVGHLITGALQLAGQNSILQVQFTAGLWFKEYLLIIAIQAMGLGLGALIAYFRITGLISLGIFWLILGFLSSEFPSASVFLPHFLLVTEAQANELVLNNRAWMIQTAISLICLIIAARLWTRHSDLSVKPRSKNLSLVANISIYGSIFLALIAYGASQLVPQALLNNVSRPHQIYTGFFVFNYLPEDRGQVELLYLEADKYAEKIGLLLSASIKERIKVDLTQDATYHLGIAGWQRMQVNRSSLLDPSERNHVFVHEASHVIAASLSNRRLGDHHNYTKFFNEGMAEWVSYELLDLDVQRQALEKLAATAWHRFDLSFVDILYFNQFAARYDENLIYAIGLVWVESLAQTCGRQAPGQAIRAMAREDMSQRLRGAQFWRDVLQQNRCSLDAVNAKLETIMAAYEDQAKQVPQLVTAVRVEAEYLYFKVKLKQKQEQRSSAIDEAAVNYPVILRIRDTAATTAENIILRHDEIGPDETINIKVDLDLIEGQKFQYQLGIEFSPDQRPFFTGWQEESIDITGQTGLD